MPAYVALLRAVNVGGTGKLKMQDLTELCHSAGCKQVTTYIQSGNAVFTSRLSAAAIKSKLEQLLAEKMGKPVSVLIRTADELRSVQERNPFPEAAPNRVLVLFLDTAPPLNALDGVVAPGNEQFKLDDRELFIHYPDGMGRSKLKLPLTNVGTGRNLNTVMKLVELVRRL